MRISFVVRAVVVPVVCLVALYILIRKIELPYAMIGAFAAAFVLFVDLATVLRGHLQNACVVAATLALGLAAVEAVAEARMPHVEESHMNLWAQDDVLGYHAETPGIVQAVKTVDGHLAYRVAYTIDDHLRRLTRSNADGPKVRFFGDSYTFGEGLQDADTLPQRFADATGANVLNYGYPGFSPAQALRALQVGMYDKDLAGAKLFVLQTAPFHVERVACKPDWTRRFPRYVLADGQLKLDGRCKPTRGQSSGIYQMLLQAQDQKIDRADVETYVAVVDAFIGLARTKYHVPVLVMDMISDANDLRGTGVTSAQIEDRFRKAGATVIDDSVVKPPGERLGIPYDGHPTAAADRLYSRKMIDAIEKAEPGLLAPAGTAAAPDADRQAQQ